VRKGGTTASKNAFVRFYRGQRKACTGKRTLIFAIRPKEDFPRAMVADEVAIFDDHLEWFLSANWPDWITGCNNFDATARIVLKKNQRAYRTATLRSGGTGQLK
jgi:hypothetical protein